MFDRNAAGRGSRSALGSAIRVGALLAGLLAVTVAFAAWSSSSTAGSTRSSTKSAALKGVSSKDCKADKAAGKITYVSPFAYDGSAGVVDVYWALHKNYFKDLCLNVTINAGSYNPQLLVEADQGQISSTGDAGNVMSFDATGGNRVVGVETIANVPSLGVMLPAADKRSTPIAEMKLLKGGSFGYYSTVNSNYVAMFKAAGVPVSSVHFLSLTDRNPAVVINQVSGVAVFLGSQDLILKADHVPFVEITPAQLGVKGTDTAYYVNKTFAKAHPIAVENFLRAQLKALSYCLVHTTACVTYLASVADAAGQGQVYGVKQNGPVWDYSAKLLKAHELKPLGTFTPTTWKPEYQQLKSFGTEANRLSGINQTVTAPPLDSMLNTTYIDSLYTKGKLVWP